MLIRPAVVSDIPQIQIVRHLVRENVLSDPSLVTDQDCEDYLMVRGKGWVAEENGQIVGFAIVDLVDHNIWALFLDPEWEGQGLGQKLMAEMLTWYFARTLEGIWLGTAPGTRAERFYLRNGWRVAGMHGKGETKFEMTYEEWLGLGQ